MEFIYVGKESVVSDALKEVIEKKLSKLNKFLPDDIMVTVKLSVIKLEEKIEVTIPIEGRVLRGEVSDKDMYTAIDKVTEVLEKQLRRYKSRLNDQYKKEPKLKEEFDRINLIEEIEISTDIPRIERTKTFGIKPMSSEEAVMEMELLGHNFFVFLNTNLEDVNVVYKRKNGSFGLIEPEY